MARPRRNKAPNPWLVATFIGGLGYPLLVYYGMAVIPPQAIVLAGLGLIGLRLFATRHNADAKIWRISFVFAAAILICMLILNAPLAARAYPVLVSLSFAAIFGLSLIYPPSLVERIARITEPDLPPSGVTYTKRVTVVWTVFLIVNAAISATTALCGTLAQWTLWNGLLSYICMGLLFAVEWCVRQYVRRNAHD